MVVRAVAAVSVAATILAASLNAQTPPRPSTPGGSEAIVPFRIQVPDAVLRDLKSRLERARFADEFPDAGWDYGTNLNYIQSLMTYWRDRYDWRAQERRLNRFSQFKTNIGGLDIHFIHQKSTDPNAQPLLLLNGWPSSPVEYDKVIEPLTKGGGGAPAFHVVVPSMPGYGFSDKPQERGYNPERMAQVWATLMARLGYSRYIRPRQRLGHLGRHLPGARRQLAHLGAAPCGMSGRRHRSAAASARGECPAAAAARVIEPRIPGDPDDEAADVGQGLSDSPLGLASWIIDKWHSWSDHDGNLETVYTKDELLTNIMFYWVTNSGTSSARLYYESRHVNGQLSPAFFATFMPAMSRGKVTVPTGCGAFPSQYDNRGLPINRDPALARKAAETRYNVVHATIAAKGGHFPALEQPQAWMDDLRTFVRTMASQ